MDKGYAAPPPPMAGDATQTRELSIVNAFMRRVYYWMAIGLSLSGVVAYATMNSPSFMRLLINTTSHPITLSSFTILYWVCLGAEFFLALSLLGKIKRVSVTTAMALFITYATLNGVTLGVMLWFFTGASVVKAFLITAGTFGAVSVWASTTKKDLSSWGSFLFMGLIGFFIASVVNIFFLSPMMEWVISVIGVVVFTGLAAYFTQQLRAMVLEAANETTVSKMAVYGALLLYIQFINLFTMILRLMGGGRD